MSIDLVSLQSFLQKKLPADLQVDISIAQNNRPVNITGITDDPWQVAKNDCYVCLEKEEFARHFGNNNSASLIQQALQNGASIFACDDKFQAPQKVNLIKTNNLNKIAGFLSRAIYNEPFKNVYCIGVTGTKGKTTTSQLLDCILRHANHKVGVIGTIGIFYPDVIEEANFLSNPHAVDLFKIGSKFKEKKVDTLVMELTSHGAYYERNAALDFDIVIMTNVTSDHLDFHQNIENYKKAKKYYFEQLIDKKSNSVAIFNIDDPVAAQTYQWLKSLQKKNIKVISYAINNTEADLKGRVIKMDGVQSVIEVDQYKKYLGQANINLPGLFNVSNSLAAITAALEMGISWQTIADGLEKKTAVPGRFEKVINKLNIDIIIDYSHTADALENILYNLRMLYKKRIITIFGCGGDRDQSKRPIMGKIASNLSDIVIITSDNPRFEDPQQIIDQILQGVSPQKQSKVIIEIDRKKAIQKGLQIAKSGDSLLIAGKGHEKYQIIGDKKIPFLDHSVVKNILEDLQTDNSH